MRDAQEEGNEVRSLLRNLSAHAALSTLEVVAVVRDRQAQGATMPVELFHRRRGSNFSACFSPRVCVGQPVSAPRCWNPCGVAKRAREDGRSPRCDAWAATPLVLVRRADLATDEEEQRPLREPQASSPLPADALFTVNVPVSAAHVRRLFRAHRQGRVSPAPAAAASGPFCSPPSAVSLTASRADLEALSCLFPAMHSGELYGDATAFLCHCQRCEEHLFACEQLPIIPLLQKKDRLEEPSEAWVEQSCRREREAEAREGEHHHHHPLHHHHAGHPELLSWFSLVYDVLVAELSHSLPKRSPRTRNGNDEEGEEEGEEEGDRLRVLATAWLPFPLAFAVAKRLALSSYSGAEGERESGAAVAREEGSFSAVGTPRPECSLAVDSWSTLPSAVAQVGRALSCEWRRLCDASLHREATCAPLSSLLLLDGAPPVEATEREALTSTAPLPPLLRAVMVPLACAVVKDVRRREARERICLLQRVHDRDDELSTLSSPSGGSSSDAAAWNEETEAAAMPSATSSASPSTPTRSSAVSNPGGFNSYCELLLTLLLADATTAADP